MQAALPCRFEFAKFRQVLDLWTEPSLGPGSRERPSSDKAQRFVDLLRQAEVGQPLSEDRFIELQNAVVDPRYREASFRTRQNWIGDEFGYVKRVEFVPPRPEDVRSLMDGLIEFAERVRAHPDAIEPVIGASALSFGFVFIHPFMDGNGRLHRYLIHDALSSAHLTPKGIVLPVSAVILSKLDEYKHALTSFSKPVNDRTSYNPDVPDVAAKGNDAVYFRYFDATAQAGFLYSAIEHTVKRDLDEEIRYLMGFDRARFAQYNCRLAGSLARFVYQCRQTEWRQALCEQA